MISAFDLLTSDVMRYPLIIAVLIGLTAPVVGTFLVQKRLSLLGDGLGHVALTGVAVGWLVGAWLSVSPGDLLAIPGALAASVLGALAIEYVREVGHTSRDVALAILFYGGIAGGVVIIQLAGGTSQNLMGYLFGSLSTVTSTDLTIAVVLAVVVLAVGLGLSGLLAAVTTDEEFARASGLPVRLVNVLIAVMAALTVTLSMRIVGALMVSALMIVPVAAAQTMVIGFGRTMRTAMAIAVAASLGGLLITVYVDLPPGGVIVLLSIGVYAIGLLSRAVLGAPVGRIRSGAGRSARTEARGEVRDTTEARSTADAGDATRAPRTSRHLT
ncbi:metal ABC transporter permease [Brachybacterium muris]|uniref:ABC transporter n=1 Tax=Brachybacterium muris UCD-AY4 TaxID=1249481 RepID=A0A022L033_9MICO|nr:metal ABC transporter permease [Brachybacterium muris]EYT50368.1 ABC transporter [Brachybacterium muris UCD-AY4]MCT1653985.1 metal ABC transporter permease [Brachybacterium muris]